eukprot:COSAG03_NODE_2209_length_3010_cov_7.030230_1_plen_96_part_00
MSSMSLSYLNSRWLGLGSSRRGVRPCASVQAATKARVELQAASQCRCKYDRGEGPRREGARTSLCMLGAAVAAVAPVGGARPPARRGGRHTRSVP